MSLIDINWKPDRGYLRRFAGLLLVFSGILGVVIGWRSGNWGPSGWIWGVGGGVGLVGLAIPSWIRPIYLLWMGLAFPIGYVVSHILLGLLFYGIFTPLGLTFRLAGRDSLQRRFNGNAPSYWVKRTAVFDRSRYYRQS